MEQVPKFDISIVMAKKRTLLYIILPCHPFISLLLSLNFVIAITDLILVMDSGSKSLSRVGLSEPSSQESPPVFSGFYS